jgi:hypothetical protein
MQPACKRPVLHKIASMHKNYNFKSHWNPSTGDGERRCLSRSPGYLTKGIELVGFPHGTAGDGDDRQGYMVCQRFQSLSPASLLIDDVEIGPALEPKTL